MSSNEALRVDRRRIRRATQQRAEPPLSWRAVHLQSGAIPTGSNYFRSSVGTAYSDFPVREQARAVENLPRYPRRELVARRRQQ